MAALEGAQRRMRVLRALEEKVPTGAVLLAAYRVNKQTQQNAPGELY